MNPNETFRQALQQEFTKRTVKNPVYSVRSFAKQLEVEPSSLAQILGGKRKLTDKMCVRLGAKLGFGPLKLRALMKENPKNSAFPKFNKLNDDAFKVIADWHYYAILELTRIDGFQGRTKWIAQALDLPFAKTVEAVERLRRLGYLEITPNNKWIDRLGDSNNLGNEFASQAFTEHQRQILGKATEALANVPYEERVQSSMTLTGSKERVKEAKSMILNFIEELDAFLKGGSTKDEVMALSVSLFPISKTSKEKK